MLQVRCQKCGWSFTLGRDSIAAIVAQQQQVSHYMVECPKCRHNIKIPAKRVKRVYRPPQAKSE